MVYAVSIVLAAYLIGSVNFAVIFTKLFANKDVRKVGSGNAGATNAVRAAGKKVGILTFVCDFGKGALASYLGMTVFASSFGDTKAIYGAYLCGLACMIGHILPLFFGFKGGKGVATGAGIFVSFCPVATVVGLCIFALCFIISKIVSVSSLIATVSVVVTALIMCDKCALFLPQALCAITMFLIIIYKHSENISRLIKGEENKFTFGGKKNV